MLTWANYVAPQRHRNAVDVRLPAVNSRMAAQICRKILSAASRHPSVLRWAFLVLVLTFLELSSRNVLLFHLRVGCFPLNPCVFILESLCPQVNTALFTLAWLITISDVLPCVNFLKSTINFYLIIVIVCYFLFRQCEKMLL